jgi:hypothetical protein
MNAVCHVLQPAGIAETWTKVGREVEINRRSLQARGRQREAVTDNLFLTSKIIIAVEVVWTLKKANK